MSSLRLRNTLRGINSVRPPLDSIPLSDRLTEADENEPRPQWGKPAEPNPGVEQAGAQGVLVRRNVCDLHPHASCTQHQLSVTTAQLSALADRGESALTEPLVVTRQGTIIDGRARLELARLEGRATLLCLEYDFTDAQALERLIQMHRRSNGMNDFSRIVLALDLEPELKEKARQNQRIGGQTKASSNLTEASRIDVRSEIARLADVSVGNVTKVKHILTRAHSDVIRAIRESEVSIHRGWSWCNLATQHQKNRLWELQSAKGVRKTIRELISKHQFPAPTAGVMPFELTALLSALKSGQLDSIRVVPVRVPGKAIFVTEELVRSLQLQGEFAFNAL